MGPEELVPLAGPSVGMGLVGMLFLRIERLP